MATFTAPSAGLQIRYGHSVSASHMAFGSNAQTHRLRAATAAVQSSGKQLHGARQFCSSLLSAARTARRGQHAANLQAPMAAAGKAVDFTVPEQPLAFGENLKLVGSLPELGSWEPESALALEWGEGDTWTSAVSLPAGAVEFKVVVARGDGSFWWEETANRTIEVPEGGGLSVTCRMGDAGATEVMGTTLGQEPAVQPAAQKSAEGNKYHSAADMSVDMADADELKPDSGAQAQEGGKGGELQTSDSDGESPVADASAAEAAIEDEGAELIEEQIGGQEEVRPAEAEVQQPENSPAPTGDDLETPAGSSGGAVAAEPVWGSHGALNAHSDAPALAKGNGQFLGRHDIEVHDDGSITFSLEPTDDGVKTLADDIMQRLQDS